MFIIAQRLTERNVIMAFDGIVTAAVARELDTRCKMGKIEKIYQPDKDELIFHIHTPSGNLKLYLSSNPNHPGGIS